MRQLSRWAGVLMLLPACGGISEECSALARQLEEASEQELEFYGEAECVASKSSQRQCNSSDDATPILEELECWIGSSRPAEVCRGDFNGVPAYIRFERLADGGPFGQDPVVTTTTGTVLQLQPLRLQVPDAGVLVVDPGISHRSLSVGESLRIELQILCPRECTYSYVLRTLDGELIQAAWNIARPPALPEATIDTQASACVGVKHYAGRALDLDVVVNGVGVAPGTQQTIAGLQVLSGPSRQLYGLIAADIYEVAFWGAINKL